MTTREELAAINEGFSRAMAAQDVEAVVAFYTEDARLLSPGKPIIRGRNAITAAFREALKDGPADVTFESGEVLEDGSLVVDIGRTTTPRGQGKYVVVYQRQSDGTLKLAVDAASNDGPPPAT